MAGKQPYWQENYCVGTPARSDACGINKRIGWPRSEQHATHLKAKVKT